MLFTARVRGDKASMGNLLQTFLNKPPFFSHTRVSLLNDMFELGRPDDFAVLVLLLADDNKVPFYIKSHVAPAIIPSTHQGREDHHNPACGRSRSSVHVLHLLFMVPLFPPAALELSHIELHHNAYVLM
jgi:hypothetical protein